MRDLAALAGAVMLFLVIGPFSFWLWVQFIQFAAGCA